MPAGFSGTQSAKKLVDNGIKAVAERADMPRSIGGVEVFRGAKLIYGPGKAASAGRAAASGFAMSQNDDRMRWNSERLTAMPAFGVM